MSAADDARRNREVIAHLGVQLQDIFVGTVLGALESIKVGSTETGAPGQPVDTARLRNSWTHEFDGLDRATISTDVEYAVPVEDAIGPHGAVLYGAKNGIGGSHSVKLTVAGMPRLLEASTRRVLGRDAR